MEGWFLATRVVSKKCGRRRMNRASFRLLGLIVVLAGLLLFACQSEPETKPVSGRFNTFATPTPRPLLSASQARGIAASCLRAAASAPVRYSGVIFRSEYLGSGKWAITVWRSEEAREKYLGDTYMVDEATGKVLNCPPSVQSARTSP